MPIRPENRARYPKNWEAVSKDIRERRARGRCECRGACGLQHYIDWQGRQTDLTEGLQMPGLPWNRCTARNGKPHPVTGAKVVLTTMHLNHRPEDVRPLNLLAACQRCHNRYDAPMRAEGIKSRKSQAKRPGRR